MPAVIRTGVDNSAGHCFSPRPPSSGSPDVFTNTSPSTRLTDAYPLHACPPAPPHGGAASAGSPDVFVNNLAFHRNGDSIDCGDSASNGSGNVFANSSQSPGIIDNAPKFADMATKSTFVEEMEEDYNLEALAQLPQLTPTDRALAENFDTVEDENEWAQNGGMGSPPDTTASTVGVPPGSTPSDTPNEVEESDEEQPAPETPTSYTCNDVSTLPSNFNWSSVSGDFDSWAASFQLSPNYTVADLTVRPVFKHRFTSSVNQPCGLTQKQVLQNMCHHAKSVLEPLRAAYGSGFIITSGFRAKSGGSQHNKGQATDLQFPALNGSGAKRNYYELAQEIRDGFTYDQLILEWGNNPWIHISSNPSSHRKSVLTQRGAGSSTFVPGLHLIA